MAWINGQWEDDNMLGGLGSLEPMGGWNPPPLPPTPPNWTQDTPFMPGPQPPFGDRPGMPNQPPQMNPPGYSRGPQMQPPFGGGLGDIDPWQPVQPPQWQPALPPGVGVIGEAIGGQPPQMRPPLNIPGRMPAPPQQPIYDRGPQMQPPVPPQFPSLPPQMQPPMPPPPPSIGDVWEPTPPPRPPVLPPIVDPPKRDTGAADRARRLAAQKARAAAKRAQDLARQKQGAAAKRNARLAAQKALAAQKRAATKKAKAAAKRVGKRQPKDQRGYDKGPGGSVTRPIGQKGYTQEGKGPKGKGTLNPVFKGGGRSRGDR
jgi:hypothetical protein